MIASRRSAERISLAPRAKSYGVLAEPVKLPEVLFTHFLTLRNPAIKLDLGQKEAALSQASWADT